MQHVSNDVLQALQQQGTSEDEAEGRKVARQKGRGRGGDGSNSSPESLETPLTLSTEVGPCASSSPPSPPLFGNATRHARLPRPTVSPGGSGRLGDLASAETTSTQANLSTSASVRPAAGSRAAQAMARSFAAAETVPSQLLGGRAGTNADFLNTPTLEFAASNKTATPALPKTPTADHLRPTPPNTWVVRHASSEDVGPRLAPTPDQIPPKTPGSNHSSSSPTDRSISSTKSYASSFAPLIRDNRVDRRLFKRKSKPSQHLRKHSFLGSLQPPMPKPSASFYKPNIVEDTMADLAPTMSVTARSPSPDPAPPMSTPLSAARPPLRRLRSSQSQSDSTYVANVLTTPATATRPALRRTPPNPANVTLSRISYRASNGTSSGSQSRSDDSVQDRRNARHDSRRPRSQAERMSSAESVYRFDMPPESEPLAPYDTSDRHGDHYFRTFGTDTVYQKQPSRDDSPTPQREHPKQVHVTPRPQGLVASSSISGFPKMHRYRSSGVGASSPTLPTPDSQVGIPRLEKDRRMPKSTESLPSYFAQPFRSNMALDATPASVTLSPMATAWEDVAAESQPAGAGHARDISETSPFTQPKRSALSRSRRPHDQTAAASSTRQLPAEAVTSVVPSGAVAGPQPKYQSSDGKKYYKASLTGPGALDFLPSEMKRVDTPPPLKRKNTGFKGFFFDMRSLPSERLSADDESFEAPATKRRAPILPKSSLQSLVSKFSRPKLKQRASEQTLEERPRTQNPLAITDFQQTPFSQRYGDARRAKMSQVRSYVNETLNEDDDENPLPFELNVPDHLPSSPLCPLSPKHKSGGKAICPVHRRAKTNLAHDAGARGKTVQKLAPRIVFESELPSDGRSPGDLKRRVS